MVRASRRVDLPLAFISLLLGMGVWLYAQSFQARKVTRAIRVPVELTDESPDLRAISYPNEVEVLVKGPPEELEKINWSTLRVRAFVSMARAEPGESEYRVAIDFPPEYRHLERTDPANVKIRTEQVMTVWKLVDVEPTSESPSGLKLGTVTVDPDKIEIKGPLSAISRVRSVKAQLDMQEAQTGRTYRLRVLVLDTDGKVVTGVETSPELISVVPVLTDTEPKRSVLVTPKWVGQPAAGFRLVDVKITPTQVSVMGDRGKLGNLLMIETEPIDLTGMRKTTSRIVSLRFPVGIRPAGNRQVTVNIRIEPVSPNSPPTNNIPPP